MIEWIKDISTWWVSGWIGMLLYWLPASFCLVGYTLKCWSEVRHDTKARETAQYYSPSITVGTIIGRSILSVIPVANLWAGLFDVAPKLFGDFFEWIGRVFSVPLVPKRTQVAQKQ